MEVELKNIWVNGTIWVWPNPALEIRLMKLFKKLVGSNFIEEDLYISTKGYIEPFKQSGDLKKNEDGALVVPAYGTSLAPYDFKYYKFVGGEVELYGRQPNFWYTKVIAEKVYIIWEI